jgi:hypothetical protein
VVLLNLRSVVPQATFFHYHFLAHHRDVGSGTSKPIIPNFKKSAATSLTLLLIHCNSSVVVLLSGIKLLLFSLTRISIFFG